MTTLNKYFTTPYEKNFNSQEAVNFANDNIKLPFLIVTIYLILVIQGIKYMKYKNPYNLKNPLVFWNAILCMFSFIGSIKTTPELINQLIYKSPIHQSINPPNNQ